MHNIKLVLLSLIFLALFTSVNYAQDKNKTTTKKEIKTDKCIEEMGSCCSTVKEKSTSTAKPFNEVCPVLGNKISPNVAPVEYKGKLYGFCCAGCDDKFKKEPEKYIGNLSSDGKKLNKQKN